VASVAVRVVVVTVRRVGLSGIGHDAGTKNMNAVGAMLTTFMNHCGIANATPGV
jgi:hypothetical protein